MMSLRMIALGLAVLAGVQAHAAGLTTAPVERTAGADEYVAEGVVEAVRETALAVEVQGRITELRVQAGDHVKSGEVLARIDARLAGQQAAASRALVDAAQARLAAAQKEYERSRQLAEKRYISQAALERAEAEFRAREAAAKADIAQAAAAEVGSSLRTLIAPYAGRISNVPVSLGDMALPGRALITLYDPRQLRVTIHVPAAVAAELSAAPESVRIEIPALPAASRVYAPTRVQILPRADPASHTAELRLELSNVPASVMPGMYARAHLARGAARARLTVPLRAVINRTELDAVYVVDGAGRATLRQVRLGEVRGDRVEIRSGLVEGERVALDPVAAAASSGAGAR